MVDVHLVGGMILQGHLEIDFASTPCSEQNASKIPRETWLPSLQRKKYITDSSESFVASSIPNPSRPEPGSDRNYIHNNSG